MKRGTVRVSCANEDGVFFLCVEVKKAKKRMKYTVDSDKFMK